MSSSSNIIHVILALAVFTSQISICAAAPGQYTTDLSITTLNAHSLSSVVSATKLANLDPSNVNAVNPGFTSGSCPVSPNGYVYGWHFVLPDISQSFDSISVKFAKAGVITAMVQQPCGMHAYVYTPTGDTLLGASANVTGTSTVFTLSDVCSPVSKFRLDRNRHPSSISLSRSLLDPCLEDNGGCDENALCSYDASTNKAQCTCKTGYTNTGTAPIVTCTGNTCSQCIQQPSLTIRSSSSSFF